MSFNFNVQPAENEGFVQESSTAPGGFTDMLQGKFEAFDPAAIANEGNRQLKSGQFDAQLESGPLAFGYKTGGQGTSPDRFSNP